MRSLSFAGASTAALFAPLATLPSLVPRAALIQGLLIALVAAATYAAGAGIGWIIRVSRRQPDWHTGSRLKTVGITLAALWLLVWLGLGFTWQRNLSEVTRTEPPDLLWPLLSIVAAALISLVLLGIGRGIRLAVLFLRQRLSRYCGTRWATFIVAVAIALIVIPLITGRALPVLLLPLDPLFMSMNNSGSESAKPNLSTVSGGPDSDISWQTLGAEGRKFIGSTNTVEQLNDFSGGGAITPVRVFAGYESAASAEERAQLALGELKRFGAFDRSVLLVGTSTGTGTVDESAVQPLELMYNGDTATVATQYSVLPSFLSFLLDQQTAQDEAIALFSAVHEYWSGLEPGQRPRLVIFGESLGAFGATAPFTDLEDLTSQTDGALLAGPPNSTPFWAYYTQRRDSGSPERQPVFDRGRSLRWANLPEALNQPTARWRGARIGYLQNASDPVVWWSPNLIWEQPDWLREPRGPGVLPDLTWLPLFTFVGLSGDMIDSQSVPVGFGHVYGNHEAAAWTTILPPKGWGSDDTSRLLER